jgi:transglutaminase-like putative cysteine protease
MTIQGICLLLLTTSVYAQKDDVYSDLRKKYSNENAVFVSRKENAVIKIEKDQPVIYSNVYEELLLLTDKTENYLDKQVYWSSFSEIQDLDAHSMVPEGNGKFKTLKVKDFARTNEISEGTFYDDSRSYKFVYPGVVNGSREILSYTEKVTDPHLYGRFFFNEYAPTEDVEYSITFPNTVKIRYKLFNVKDSGIVFTSSQSGKNTTYTWKIHGAKKMKSEENAPSLTYYAPHIIVLVDEYTVGKETKKVLSDTTALYDWYYGFVRNVNTSVSPEMQKVVDSLTVGTTSDLEKVRNIFYWVQNDITYIAYEDSLGGFIPREGSLVCSRRFGDCKDMASTLTQMIQAAGLKAYQTWIGTRDIPYSFTDVPAPLATNHMICTYISNDGKLYFLDATGKEAPFGYHTSMIQGKEAMLGMGKGKFVIARVPVMDTSDNTYSDTTNIHLENNTVIKGDGIMRTSGYDKIMLDWRIKNMDKKDRHDFVAGLLRKGSNKFNVDSISYENLGDRNKGLGIHYTFDLDNYVQKNNNELYINMQMEKQFMNDLMDADRQAPREFEYKTIDRNVNTLEIPKGYKVSYMPDNSSYSTPLFGYNIKYTVKGNTIVNESSIYINTLMINPSDFAEWNKMIHKLTRAYNESVTLTKQ